MLYQNSKFENYQDRDDDADDLADDDVDSNPEKDQQ